MDDLRFRYDARPRTNSGPVKRDCVPHIALSLLLLLSACNSGQDTAEPVMGERTPVPQEATERVFPAGDVEFVDTLKVDDPLFYPDKVVVLSSGELLVAVRGSHQAVRLDADGEVLARYGAGSGEGPGEHRYLGNVGVFPDGTVWTLDTMNLRINLFERDGSFIRSSVPTTVVQAATALTSDEFVGVVVMMPDRFVAFDLDGSVIRRWGWFVDEPLPNAMPFVGAPLQFDRGSGFVYVPLFGSRLMAYSPEGNLL